MRAQAHLPVHTGLKLSRLALEVWTLVLIMDGGKVGGEGCNINIPHPTHLCYGGVVGGGENTSVTLKQPTAKFTAWHWRCGPLYSGWGDGRGRLGGVEGRAGRWKAWCLPLHNSAHVRTRARETCFLFVLSFCLLLAADTHTHK